MKVHSDQSIECSQHLRNLPISLLSVSTLSQGDRYSDLCPQRSVLTVLGFHWHGLVRLYVRSVGLPPLTDPREPSVSLRVAVAHLLSPELCPSTQTWYSWRCESQSSTEVEVSCFRSRSVFLLETSPSDFLQSLPVHCPLHTKLLPEESLGDLYAGFQCCQ